MTDEVREALRGMVRIETTLEARFDALERMVSQMSATLADLDQALTDFETAQEAADLEVLNAVNDILAKVNQTGVDLTSEVARLTAAHVKMTAAADAIKALDLTPVVVTPAEVHPLELSAPPEFRNPLVTPEDVHPGLVPQPCEPQPCVPMETYTTGGVVLPKSDVYTPAVVPLKDTFTDVSAENHAIGENYSDENE